MEATVNVMGLRMGTKQICPFDTLALGHRAASTLYSSSGLRVESGEGAGGIATVSGWTGDGWVCFWEPWLLGCP